MADGIVQVPPDSTGKKVDTSELTNSSSATVERQRISIGDPVTFANMAAVTSSSALKVDGSAVTQPISGTITANAGTNLNTSALALDTSVNGILLSQGSTTSGQKGPIILGAVTTSAPSYTTAQTSPLSLDTAGNLRVSLQASGATVTVSGTVTANQGGAPWSDNITQFGGTNISTGTGTGGAGIPRVTVSSDSSITANAGTNLNTSLLALDTSVNGILLSQGSTTSGQKGNLTQGAVTTNAPSYTTAQTSPISLDTSGLLRISLKDTPQNTNAFLVAQSGSWSVTANAGTNLNTSALALDTSVNGILVSQGSTTSGEKGPLIQGAVTTSAPSYTTAQTSPLSLDTAGNLRISLQASGATVTVAGSGTFTTSDSHFPASVALADNLSNPTTTEIGANLLGWDATNTVWRRVQVDAGTGTLKVDGSGSTQPVSGTVTANQGGAPWSVVGTLSNNAAAPAANNVGALVALAGSASPSYTTGDQVLLSTDLSGNLRVTGSLSVGGTTDESAFTAGTSTGTPAMGAYQTTVAPLLNNQVGIVALDQNRNMRVNIAASSGTINVSHAGIPQPVYLDDQNTNYDDDGNPYFNPNVPGADIATGALQSSQLTVLQQIAAGVPVSQQGSWAITANAGTNLNTSALALDTSVNGILLAQASTTSGQKGPLAMGAVTTNAPSYTTAQTDPLSLDTSGLLRISLKDTPSNTNNFNVALAASSATVTVSATNLSTNVAQFGGTNVVTGTGASGSGIPRVTVSNDSNILATQSGTWTVQQGGAPWSMVGTLTNNSAAPAANNVGVLPAIASSAAQSYTAGDQVLLNTDLSGNLKVTGSLSVGGTTDETAFTAGTSTGTSAMGSYQNTITPLTNNQVGIVALDQNRSMRVNIAAASVGPLPIYLDDQNNQLDDNGVLFVNTNVDGADIATGANQIAQTALLTQLATSTRVTGTVAVSNLATTQPVSFSGALTTTYSGVPQPVYLDDQNTALDDNGIPYVNINLEGQDIATPLQQIANAVGPTNLAVSPNAHYIGGNASNALPTPNAIGGLTGVMTDKFGRQVCLISTVRDLLGTQTTTISASTSETTIVTAASNVFNDLILLVVSNTSASTNTRIDFRDTTGGTVLFSLESNGGQPPIGFSMATPIPQTGTNTNWTATCATSTTDIRIYAVWAKNR